MKRKAKLAILVASPLLMAALWMDKQPSYKPYQTPALATPAGSVPVSGKESVELPSGMKNPVAPGEASLALGKALFEINCALCHGQTSAKPGPVGRKFTPPPPGLDHGMVQGLSDSDIFNAIARGFGRMPPFRDKITPAERWSLVNFLRTRK
jgi:mono/diheme cytochrome c family protein